ncbi:hypothetical protein BFL35_02135 [Clavibacter michiganensis]|nr:hypothetical protein BFL35_02135 [Clavibacter michiganensis]
MTRLTRKPVGITTMAAAIGLAIAFTGASGAQAATRAVEAPAAQASEATTAPPVTVVFSGQTPQDIDYYVLVSRAGDPSAVYMTMLDDNDGWATTSTTGFSERFTFETPAIPDPSGWGVFDTPDTYTATLVPMGSVDAQGLSQVTSAAILGGPRSGVVSGAGTSVSWTVD